MGKVILLLCLAGLVFAQSDSLILYSSSDCYANWYNPNTNYNDQYHGLYVGYASYAIIVNSSFMDFDLSTFPSDAQVDSAFIYAIRFSSRGTFVMYAGRVLYTWSETQLTATVRLTGVNWDSLMARSIGVDWIPLDSQVVAGDVTLKFNATSTFNAINLAGVNYGIKFDALAVASSGDKWQGWGRQAVLSKRPYAVIYYTVMAATGAKWRGYYDGENLRTWGIK